MTRITLPITFIWIALTWPGSCCDAGVIRAGFDANTFGPTDDGSAGPTTLGFQIKFGGTTYENAIVNNNGNVTFDGNLSDGFTSPINDLTEPFIGPFWGDVDTRGNGSGLVTYGTGSVDGRSAFAATWNGVGYFDRQVDRLNFFQAVLIDRSDFGMGDFDIEFNYDQIQWDAGTAFPDNFARVGFTNGSGVGFEFPTSGVSGAFLDGGSSSLTANSNVDMPGRYLFTVRNPPPGQVPEPSTLLAFAGILCVGLRVRNVRKRARPFI